MKEIDYDKLLDFITDMKNKNEKRIVIEIESDGRKWFGYSSDESGNRRDAVKLEIEHVKSDRFLDDNVKDFIIDVIKDGAGKDTKGFKVHVTNEYSGFGSRKDMEKRLAKIKADPKNLHKCLPRGF